MSVWAGGPLLVIEDLWFTDLLVQDNSHCKPFMVSEDFLGNEPRLLTESFPLRSPLLRNACVVSRNIGADETLNPATSLVATVLAFGADGPCNDLKARSTGKQASRTTTRSRQHLTLFPLRVPFLRYVCVMSRNIGADEISNSAASRGAAVLDFGAAGHFNDFEDAIKRLSCVQNYDPLQAIWPHSVSRRPASGLLGVLRLALTLISSYSEDPTFSAILIFQFCKSYLESVSINIGFIGVAVVC